MDVERRLGLLENTLSSVSSQLGAQLGMMNTANSLNGATANVNISPIDLTVGQVPVGWQNGVRDGLIAELDLEWPERGTQGLVLVSANYQAMSNGHKPEWGLGGSQGMTASNIPKFEGELKVSSYHRTKTHTTVLGTHASGGVMWYTQNTVCAFPISFSDYEKITLSYKLLCDSDKGGLLDSSTAIASLSGAFITF